MFRVYFSIFRCFSSVRALFSPLKTGCNSPKNGGISLVTLQIYANLFYRSTNLANGCRSPKLSVSIRRSHSMEKEFLAHSSPLTALTRYTARKFGEKLFLFLDSLPLYSEHVTLYSELLSILDSFVLDNPKNMSTHSFLSVLEYVSGDAVAHNAATDAVSAGSHCSYGSANCPKTCDACPTTKPSDLQSKHTDHPCVDQSEHCASWSRAGYCTDPSRNAHREKVRASCKKSCNLCSTGDEAATTTADTKGTACLSLYSARTAQTCHALNNSHKHLRVCSQSGTATATNSFELVLCAQAMWSQCRFTWLHWILLLGLSSITTVRNQRRS